MVFLNCTKQNGNPERSGYGIEKLQKATGLDIRTFEDAMTFKIAMMVVNYMKYLDTLEY